ncbi:hypothetical protein ASG20_00900 [Sphingomonas sp. Leaf198]|nr:hypothetical protein ASG20_00900 [Sphingomonas sp. Leaf198]
MKENTFCIAHDVDVGQPNSRESQVLHQGIPVPICRLVVGMAIHFEDEADRWTEEVDDATAEHSLSPELEATQLAIGYAAPQALFGLGRFSTHMLRVDGQRRSPPQPLP